MFTIRTALQVVSQSISHNTSPGERWGQTTKCYVGKGTVVLVWKTLSLTELRRQASWSLRLAKGHFNLQEGIYCLSWIYFTIEPSLIPHPSFFPLPFFFLVIHGWPQEVSVFWSHFGDYSPKCWLQHSPAPCNSPSCIHILLNTVKSQIVYYA